MLSLTVNEITHFLDGILTLKKIKINFYSDKPMGFLPNGDLIVVSLDNELKDYKIYLYPFENKPITNSTLWEYSQIYDIEIPESLKGEREPIKCFIYQEKLFL